MRDDTELRQLYKTAIQPKVDRETVIKALKAAFAMLDKPRIDTEELGGWAIV